MQNHPQARRDASGRVILPASARASGTANSGKNSNRRSVTFAEEDRLAQQEIREQARETEQRLRTAFHQKENKYIPLLDINARNLLEVPKPPPRAITFVEEEEAPVEVEENPIYLRMLEEDAQMTVPGQPFHPSYPGATRVLREKKRSHAEQLYLQQPPIAYDESTRSVLQQPFLANEAINAPVGTMREVDPFIEQQLNPSNRMTMMTGSRGGGGGGAGTGTPQPAGAAAGASSNNATTTVGMSKTGTMTMRTDREAQLANTLHQQHIIRRSCSDAVDIVRSLLYFRNVDTTARDGPHNAVTSRHMQTDFLMDLQWLLKEGLMMIKYPNSGGGGAPHMRHFTIWMMPWCADATTPPVMAPFLVWLPYKNATRCIGKVPLCNLLGVTKNVHDSAIFRKYLSDNGRLIKGPHTSGPKRITLPVEHAASLWFLCHQSGKPATADARSFDYNPATASGGGGDGGSNNSPTMGSSSRAGNSSPGRTPGGGGGGGGLDAETAAARGFGPAPTAAAAASPTASHNASGQPQNHPYEGDPSSSVVLAAGQLGRINIDIVGLQFSGLERFLRLMDGICAVNEVLVRRPPAE